MYIEFIVLIQNIRPATLDNGAFVNMIVHILAI